MVFDVLDCPLHYNDIVMEMPKSMIARITQQFSQFPIGMVVVYGQTTYLSFFCPSGLWVPTDKT